MIREAIFSADSFVEDSSDAVGEGDWRISGWTMRLGEYVLITEAAPGVHITWDCGQRPSVIVHCV